ncbi:MAG: hypothetical protein QY323_04125 [Patescibacteria group bacterium]|nr:MAG: hypothetical protein QY323_04125 [Patescibacteria group bacterium]
MSSPAAETVDAILLALWRTLDAGGVSEGRSRHAAILEAITRGKLLPRCIPDEGRAPLETATQISPDTSYFAACAFKRPPSKLRKKELLAVLLAWLREHYQQERERHPAWRPVGEHVYLKTALRILPLPETVPLLPFEILMREHQRRRLRKYRKRLGAL